MISMTLFGCGQSKSSSEGDPHAHEKGKAFEICGVTKAAAGAMASRNIIGGTVVEKGQADAKAAIMLMSDSGSICTAAAISRNVLLTAAHCLAKDEGYIAFFAPSMTCASGFDISKDAIRATRVVRHSGYDLEQPDVTKRRDDVGLVFLGKDIPEGYPVYKIADPQTVGERNELLLYGYGVTGDNLGGAGTLRKASVNSQRYRIDLGNKLISVNQAGTQGLCMGDSGGPGLVQIGSELQILGVNSFVHGQNGEFCNDLGYETIADSYKDWIEFQMK